MQFLRPTRPPLHLRPGPNARSVFSILDGHQVCFLLRLFVSGRRHNERARAAQREAEQNDDDFKDPTHEQAPVVRKNPALNVGDK